jgi:hypothetical protein
MGGNLPPHTPLGSPFGAPNQGDTLGDAAVGDRFGAPALGDHLGVQAVPYHGRRSFPVSSRNTSSRVRLSILRLVASTSRCAHHAVTAASSSGST